MQETVGNAGTGSENRNHGYGKCPEELFGTENTWKDSISGSVHRLDQPVEGVLVFAKTQGAAGNLSKQIMAGGAGKYYLAVTEGVPGKQEGIFIDYLKKNGKANMSQAVPENTPGAKKAILHYRVLDQKEMNGKIPCSSRSNWKQDVITRSVYSFHMREFLFLETENTTLQGKKVLLLAYVPAVWNLTTQTGKIMKFETEPQGTAFLDFVKKL